MTIDWTKPIEAEDGTPLKLCQHGISFGDNANPDEDGDYWVMREGEVETSENTYCVYDVYNYRFGQIRNSTTIPTIIPKTKTLRDEFAMAALAGLLSHSQCGAIGPWGDKTKDVANAACKEAYYLADAMMMARGGGECQP